MRRAALVAPHCLQNKVLAMMDDEIRRARAGEEAYIGVKINSLTDKAIIDKLIEASCAGVKVDLVVRGICCLIAGVPEATENIRVVSIVGRFLEHSRIYIFGRGERAKVYIASADFMTRNTLRRVEVASPVMDADIRARILAMFDTMLRDNMQAREMDAQGQYHRLTPGESEPLSSQEYFFKQAYDAVSPRRDFRIRNRIIFRKTTRQKRFRTLSFKKSDENCRFLLSCFRANDTIKKSEFGGSRGDAVWKRR